MKKLFAILFVALVSSVMAVGCGGGGGDKGKSPTSSGGGDKMAPTGTGEKPK